MTEELNKYSISKLIYKAISQTIKSKEKEKLNQWLKIDGNRELYNKIIQTKSIKNKIELYSQSDKEKVFIKIQKKIHLKEKQKSIRKKYLKIFKYAASILILIMAGNYIYKTSFDKKFITKKAVKNIKPGYEKATLILSNGTEVNLEEQLNKTIATTSTLQIKNTNKGLIYTPTTNTNEITEAIAEGKTTEYNTLNVPVGGMFSVKLTDGTSVWLNSASTITFPTRFTGEQRVVTLSGEAYFDVTKSSKEFIVKTNGIDITVLGTEFNVSAYIEDSKISTTLVEGKVTMSGSKNSVILTPNQQGFLLSSNANIKVKQVDTETYTAWKEGKFYFEKEQLNKILAKMSRWYNIKVLFDDITIKHETFTGVVLKNKPIDYLLNSICETTSLTYNITQNKETKIYEVKISRK